MHCEQARELLSGRLDNQLSSDDQAGLDNHLASCATCRADAEALRAQDAELRVQFAPRREAAAAVAERVIARLAPRLTPRRAGWRPSTWSSRGQRLAGVLTASAALATLALVLPGSLPPVQPPADTPDKHQANRTRDERPDDTLRPWPRPSTRAAERVPVGKTVRTKAGERRRLLLPDGSTVYLNENTALAVETERQLNLTEGEIFVEVAPRRPGSADARFLVRTPNREVVALGTKFDVRAGQAGTGVVVTQGKVRVSGLDGILAAGQQLLPGAGLLPAPRSTHVLDWARDLMAAAAPALVPPSRYEGGALVAVDPNGQTMDLSLRKYHIDVHIEDGFARTTIDQTYFNHSPAQLEGTFYFPLPPDASLSRLAMYVDGKLMEGGMAERDFARNVYEQIKFTRRDPALLEWVDGSTFRMRVFPLEPRQEKRIILTYTQRLESLYGRQHYRFPGGHSLPGVGEWSLHARVKGGAGLGWSCASHALRAKKDGRDLILNTGIKMARPDQDVVLSLEEGDEAAEAVRFSSAAADGRRYLMLRCHLPDAAGAIENRKSKVENPRHWVFLYESSGDRDPLLARTQVEVIRTLLDNIEHDDTFTILAAGTHVQTWSPLTSGPEAEPAARAKGEAAGSRRANASTLASRRGLGLRGSESVGLPATPNNIRSAIDFLDHTRLVGALDLGHGLAAAEPILQAAGSAYLVHVGSGVAAMGERRGDVLAKRLPERTTYVGVGVGKRWARGFMKQAAERTGGYFTQINPDEPVAWRAFDLFATLHTPRLLGARVVDNAERVRFQSYATSVAQGEELCAVARLGPKDKLPESVTVAGLLDGRPYHRVVPVKDVAEHADYLPRTWAKLEIDRLLAEDSKKNKDRVVALSKAMYVMSPYTSLLVLENEAMYAQFKVDRGRKDLWAIYPCPDKIAVVREPEPAPPQPPKDGKGSPKEVLETVLVRVPGRFLNWPGQQNAAAGQEVATAWDAYTGDVGYVIQLEPLGPMHLFRLESERQWWQRLGQAARAATIVPDFRFQSTYDVNGVGRREFGPPMLSKLPYSNRLFRNGRSAPRRGDPDLENDEIGIDMEGLFHEESAALLAEALATEFAEWQRAETTKLAADLEHAADNSNRAVHFIPLKHLYPTLAKQAVDALMGRMPSSGSKVEARAYRGNVDVQAFPDMGGVLIQGNKRDLEAVTQMLHMIAPMGGRSGPGSANGGLGRGGFGGFGFGGFGSGGRGGFGRGFEEQARQPAVGGFGYYQLEANPYLYWVRPESAAFNYYGAVPPGVAVYATVNPGPMALGYDARPTGWLYQSHDRLEPDDGPKQPVRVRADVPTSAGGFLRPGSRVDVVYVGRWDGKVQSTTVLEDVVVRTVDAGPSQQRGAPELDATLELGPRQAAVLNWLRATGTITLVLHADQHPSDGTSQPPPPPPSFAGARQVEDSLRSVSSSAAAGTLLYQRPTFSGHDRIFYDLVAYAPGMNTCNADILAVLEAEARLAHPPTPGNVSADARRLIERARGLGWQRVTLPTADGLSLAVDGAGRYTYDRTLPLGLHEQVVCDGRSLLHLYPELGIGARREVSRFHRDAFARVVPWLVPPVTDLALDADVSCTGERTVVVTPHRNPLPQGEREKKYACLHLVFAADGRLAERRLVARHAGKVLLREIYEPNGKVKLLDAGGKTLWQERWAVGRASAPDLMPNTDKLVVVPLPYRSVEHVRDALKIEGVGYEKLNTEAALALFAADIARQKGDDAVQLFGRRFHARGDRRLGFYTLLAACGVNVDADKEYLNVLALYRRDTLARYLACHGNPELRRHFFWGTPEEAGASFVERLAGFRGLYDLWQKDAFKRSAAAERQKEQQRALDIVKQNYPSALGWVLLSVLEDRVRESKDQPFLRKIADVLKRYEDVPGVGYLARYERARCLLDGGGRQEARKLFRELYEDTLKQGVLPPIDASFRDALHAEGKETPEWAGLVRLTAAALVKDRQWPAALALTWQCWQLGDRPMADHVLAAALHGLHKLPAVSGIERLAATLAAVDFFLRAQQPVRADELVRSLLADERFARFAGLWRLDQRIAEQRKLPARSLACLEKALELEYHHLPAVINLEAVRADYGALLNHYQQVVDAMTTLEVKPPPDLAMKVVRAADRWRALDHNTNDACRLAAKVLHALGEKDLAWEYLTTPIGLRPNESEPWLALAQSERADGDYDLADRAYAAAFEAEPTNAQLLWDRAEMLQQAGKVTDARRLFRQLAQGDWQPRFSDLQSQARWQLTGGSP
jgi:tetratricopeptide (TPR) repeat protein